MNSFKISVARLKRSILKGQSLNQLISHNPPIDHHYIPVFYLTSWATGADQRVCQFSKPWNNKVVANRRAPGATGFERGLYEIRGLHPSLAQQVEQKFFQPVDDEAAKSLKMLIRYGHGAPWDTESRSAWTRFILSLLMRCPEDIAAFRSWWPEQFKVTDDELEIRYQSNRAVGDPRTFSEFLASQPISVIESFQARLLMHVIDHPTLGPKINDMHWRVREIPEHCHALLTSDRPVMRPLSIGGKNGHLALPITPRLLFIASDDDDFIKGIARTPPETLVSASNRMVVEAAARFVWGEDDSQLRFVQNRLGRTPQRRPLADVMLRNR